MNELSIHLYKDKWNLCPFVEIAGGFGYHDAPPVTIIEWGDKKQLKLVIQRLFDQPMSVVDPEALFSSPDPLGVRPRAVGAKSANAYFRNTRCFYLHKEENQILLEEWPRARGYWSANPVWKKKFASDQLDKLIVFLMRKTKVEGRKFPDG